MSITEIIIILVVALICFLISMWVGYCVNRFRHAEAKEERVAGVIGIIVGIIIIILIFGMVIIL